MPAVQNKLSARLAALKARHMTVEYKKVETPKNAVDIMSTIKAASGLTTDFSNVWTRNLLPNLIPVQMYCMLQAKLLAPDIDTKKHAKLSVPTVAMYFTSIIFGFFLACDAFVRPSPSLHAQDWLNNNDKHEFIDYLLELPVPEFLIPIFKQWAPTVSDRRKNIITCPSAAGFSYPFHFGRYLPVNFFTELHDIATRFPGNSKREEIFAELFTVVLNRVRYNSADTGISFGMGIADLIGVITPTADDSVHQASRLYQIFESVFNPVLFRDYQRRPTLAAIDLTAPKFDTTHPNAYDVFFAYKFANLAELRIVLDDIKDALSGSLNFSGNLCQIIAGSSGIYALDHGYSAFPLPTWSSNPQGTWKYGTKFNKGQDPDAIATTMTFMTKPSGKAATKSIAKPTILKSDDGKTTTDETWTIESSNYPSGLLSDNPGSKLAPLATDFETFNEQFHFTPPVVILDVSGDCLENGHIVLIAGKVIESFELAGTTVEHPRADKPLGLQNSLFADAAINMDNCIPGMSFYARGTGNLLPPPRSLADYKKQQNHPASSLFVDRTKIVLPKFTRNLVDATVPATLPGYTDVSNTHIYNWLAKAQSFMGFHTRSARDSASFDVVTGLPKKSIYLFSPYSFVPFENEVDDPIATRYVTPIYLLSNERSNHGNDIPLVRSKHIYETMPSK